MQARSLEAPVLMGSSQKALGRQVMVFRPLQPYQLQESTSHVPAKSLPYYHRPQGGSGHLLPAMYHPPPMSPQLQLTCYSVPLRSLFTGVMGTSPLTLSVPLTDIKLLRSFWFDLCSTFVTLNLSGGKRRCDGFCFSTERESWMN